MEDFLEESRFHPEHPEATPKSLSQWAASLPDHAKLSIVNAGKSRGRAIVAKWTQER